MDAAAAAKPGCPELSCRVAACVLLGWGLSCMVPVIFPAEDGAPCHGSALRLAVCAGSAAKPPPVLGWGILLCAAAACCMCCASGTPGSGVICGTAPLRAAAERCCGPCRAGWPAGHARPALPGWPKGYPAVLAELAAEAFSRAPGPPGGKPIKPCSGAGLLCARCCCVPMPEADCACTAGTIMSYRSECHISSGPRAPIWQVMSLYWCQHCSSGTHQGRRRLQQSLRSRGRHGGMEDPRGCVSGCSGCHHQRQAGCSL